MLNTDPLNKMNNIPEEKVNHAVFTIFVTRQPCASLCNVFFTSMHDFKMVFMVNWARARWPIRPQNAF